MKIIVIEGLFGELGGWARRPLKEAGIAYTWYPWWWSKIELPEGCIVLSHSFGAARHIKELNAQGTEPTLSISVDPRTEPREGFSYVGSHHYNFYQTGFMRGYPVSFARNIHVKGYSHTQMPMYPEIIKLIKEAM